MLFSLIFTIKIRGLILDLVFRPIWHFYFSLHFCLRKSVKSVFDPLQAVTVISKWYCDSFLITLFFLFFVWLYYRFDSSLVKGAAHKKCIYSHVRFAAVLRYNFLLRPWQFTPQSRCYRQPKNKAKNRKIISYKVSVTLFL